MSLENDFGLPLRGVEAIHDEILQPIAAKINALRQQAQTLMEHPGDTNQAHGLDKIAEELYQAREKLESVVDQSQSRAFVDSRESLLQFVDQILCAVSKHNQISARLNLGSTIRKFEPRRGRAKLSGAATASALTAGVGAAGDSTLRPDLYVNAGGVSYENAAKDLLEPSRGARGNSIKRGSRTYRKGDGRRSGDNPFEKPPISLKPVATVPPFEKKNDVEAQLKACVEKLRLLSDASPPAPPPPRPEYYGVPESDIEEPEFPELMPIAQNLNLSRNQLLGCIEYDMASDRAKLCELNRLEEFISRRDVGDLDKLMVQNRSFSDRMSIMSELQEFAVDLLKALRKFRADVEKQMEDEQGSRRLTSLQSLRSLAESPGFPRSTSMSLRHSRNLSPLATRPRYSSFSSAIRESDTSTPTSRRSVSPPEFAVPEVQQTQRKDSDGAHGDGRNSRRNVSPADSMHASSDFGTKRSASPTKSHDKRRQSPQPWTYNPPTGHYTSEWGEPNSLLFGTPPTRSQSPTLASPESMQLDQWQHERFDPTVQRRSDSPTDAFDFRLPELQINDTPVERSLNASHRREDEAASDYRSPSYNGKFRIRGSVSGVLAHEDEDPAKGCCWSKNGCDVRRCLELTRFSGIFKNFGGIFLLLFASLLAGVTAWRAAERDCKSETVFVWLTFAVIWILVLMKGPRGAFQFGSKFR